MKDKVDVENLEYKLRSFLRTKKLSDNDSLRKYFNKWPNNVLKGIEPEALYKLLAKLIEITLNNYKRKILESLLIILKIYIIFSMMKQNFRVIYII